MKEKISAGILTAALFLLIAAVVWSKPSSQPSLLEADSIAQIQLDLVKMDTERFDKARLEAFLENIQAATPIAKQAAMQVDRPDEDFVLAFLDKDGERKSFSFFCADGTYYMETEQGDLYETTDFMKEYLAGNNGWFPTPRGIGAVQAADSDNIKYALDTQYDTRYWLFCMIQKKKAEGFTEEEAAEGAKSEMLWQYRMYQYAVENGYGIPDESYEKMIEDWIAEAKQQEDYASAEQKFENCGTTLEEHIRQSARAFWRISDTVDYMQFLFQEEFRKEGKDTVDGAEYGTAGDYAKARMNQVVLSECESIDTSEFEKELEGAEQTL